MSESIAPGALAALVAHHEGSAVSKTQSNRDGGSVTLFALEAGWDLNEQTAPFEPIVTEDDGEAEVITGGRVPAVAAGAMIIMRPIMPT